MRDLRGGRQGWKRGRESVSQRVLLSCFGTRFVFYDFLLKRNELLNSPVPFNLATHKFKSDR